MRVVFILLVVLLSYTVCAQNLSKKELKERKQADSISGVYIPKDIEECFTELDKLLTPEDIAEIKSQKSANGTIKYHHSLGMWLRNNWGLWGGSRLSHYFTKRGYDHPDGMSGVILGYYWDWLHEYNEGWQAFDQKRSRK